MQRSPKSYASRPGISIRCPDLPDPVTDLIPALFAGAARYEEARTPDRAGYPMWPVIRERVAVELDTDAEPLLAELMLGSRGQFGNRNVEVWLRRENPGLIVHIGSRRIGRLDARAVEAFGGAIDAAADRDEDVRTDAHLTRMTGAPAYVLDLPLYDAGTS